jgi:1-acyl-sn-glycerol-3-phosphate acyltransferase
MPRHGLRSKINCWCHRRFANAFGIPVHVFGTPSDKATLFVANHISWFDIIAIGGILPVRFLSKIEVRDSPVIGWLASRAGTLYIPRGGKSAARDANTLMANALKQDNHVVLFAEGTTGDGNIRRFHSRLIQSAITAGCVVQPIALRYPKNNENNVHPAALFVGDTTMAQSFKKIMSASDLVVEVHFLEPIEVTNKNRDELATYAENRVREVIENEREAS